MLDTVTPARENVDHPLGKVTTTLGEEAELISDSHKVGEGLGAHPGHHLLAVRFHRGLARAQLARDLFVEQPGHHPRHHVPLPRSERVKPVAQDCHICPLLMRGAVAGERPVHGVEQS